MNRILIIAHTPLASALKSAALHALPDAARRVVAIDVQPDDAPQATLDMARQQITLTKQAGFEGLLVMSDVLGATPCNVAQQLIQPMQNDAQGIPIKCIAGASLPMLLRAMTYSDKPLVEMVQKAVAGAAQGAIELT